MYLYFDEKGVLLEAINDEALRQYNHRVNTMYVYTDIPIDEIKSLQYWFELPNGDNTIVYSTETHNDKLVHETIPPNAKRDVQKFKYGQKYWMYRIELPSGKEIIDEEGNYTGRHEDNIFEYSGPVAVTIQVIYKTEGRKELTLGKVVFTVEDEVVVPSETITVSQFEYLLNAVDAAVSQSLDYNNLKNKPRINGEELIGDKTAEELRLVPIDLRPLKTFRELAYEPTKSFRQQAELFVSMEGNGFTMTLQDVKNLGTKIVTVDDVEAADTTNLDIGDYVYSKN